MDNKIVVFKDNKVTIIHTNDVSPYKGRTDVLINPEIPRRVPPHMWKMRDGKIVTIGIAEPAKHVDIIQKQSNVILILLKYAVPILVAFAIGFLLHK